MSSAIELSRSPIFSTTTVSTSIYTCIRGNQKGMDYECLHRKIGWKDVDDGMQAVMIMMMMMIIIIIVMMLN